jgi:hypothetical protein
MGLSLVALTLFSGQGQAQPPAAKKQAPQYRCAYIGEMGSFHLIENGGSAAYELGGERFIADLAFLKQDANFRYYIPTHGDPATTHWAFAKHADCGLYRVWRQVNGRMSPFEPTTAWGIGLEGSTGPVTAFTDDVDQKLRAIDLRLDKHDRRLDQLEKRSGVQP